MKKVKIKPTKVDKTKIILDLIRENARLRRQLDKKPHQLFGGNPTEYFRKIRERTH